MALQDPAIWTPVEQRDRRDLVRHGDQRATNIGQAEERLEHRRVVVGLHAHGHDDGVDSGLLEIRVVDHRCLEALGRIAEMCDERRLPGDHRTSFVAGRASCDRCPESCLAVTRLNAGARRESQAGAKPPEAMRIGLFRRRGANVA
jgi:hypothetical protein